MPRTNKDKIKDPVIDEVLAETPPDINEPQVPEPEDSEIAADAIADPENEEKKEPDQAEVESSEQTTPEEPEQVEPIKEDSPAETDEQKDQRYKAQQTEAQIQAERNRALTDRVQEAANLKDPTVEELKAFVQQDGINWDELTNFEQATAKRTYIAEKRFQLVNESVQEAKKVDEWAAKVDAFIDTTDGKPEFIDLSSHEADFRKFSMKEAHRGTPMDILLGAFLHNLPAAPKNRGSLFNSGGGGDKGEAPKTGVIDADQAAKLRSTDPKEYKRLLKAGKIKLEI